MPERAPRPYYRLSGAGNDFLALVEPETPPTEAEIRAWCRRGLSLGADGLFLLHRTPAGARMIYHNADGGRSTLCLNGSRTAARLAFHLGWHRGALLLETDAGTLRARELPGDRIALELPDLIGPQEAMTLESDGRSWPGTYLLVGVPHFVLPWPGDLATAPLTTLGPRLRSHPRLPEGANINFVHREGPQTLSLRTYERGVEAETLACGTGILAAVATASAAGHLHLPATVHTHGGFSLEVTHDPHSLTGDARLLAHGHILPGADFS